MHSKLIFRELFMKLRILNWLKDSGLLAGNDTTVV
jgi:hypothetical protein